MVTRAAVARWRAGWHRNIRTYTAVPCPISNRRRQDPLTFPRARSKKRLRDKSKARQRALEDERTHLASSLYFSSCCCSSMGTPLTYMMRDVMNRGLASPKAIFPGPLASREKRHHQPTKTVTIPLCEPTAEMGVCFLGLRWAPSLSHKKNVSLQHGH